eukprot:sb/3464951/
MSKKTLITKVIKTGPSSSLLTKPKQKTSEVWTTKQHLCNAGALAKKYLENPRVHPRLVYDKTRDLQIVKPYIMTVNTRLTSQTVKLTGKQWLELTSRDPIPRCLRSQHLTSLIEGGVMKVDGKIIPPDMLLKGRDQVIRTHHRHERVVPVVRVDGIIPEPVIPTLWSVDKPAGLPALMDLRTHYYNSLPFMLHSFKLLPTATPIVVNNLGLASGIVLLGSNHKAVTRFRRVVGGGGVQFEYLARVHGHMEKSGDDVEVLQRNAGTTLVRVVTSNLDIKHVTHSLFSKGHPVLNDWENLQNFPGAYITKSLTLDFADRPIDGLFSGKRKKLVDSKIATCSVMENPLSKTKELYVVEPQNLKLTGELSEYYNSYTKTVRGSHVKTTNCAECNIMRLPLPVPLLSPNIHLQSVVADGMSVISRETPSWA